MGSSSKEIVKPVTIEPDAVPVMEPVVQGGFHRVVAPGEAGSTAIALAERIAGNAPLTLRAAKTALWALASGDPALRATRDRDTLSTG